MTRKLLQQALEALEWEHGGEPLPTLTIAAIEAIRAELTKPERKPDDFEEIIDAYLEDYVFEGEEGSHTPDEFGRFVIKDAIMGLLAKPAQWHTEAEVQRLTRLARVACTAGPNGKYPAALALNKHEDAVREILGIPSQ